ncbi:MAG: ribose-phosphate diphosphokinase [Candidatus Heimdallarchaeota archaeon]
MTTVISGPGQPEIGKQLAEILSANHISVKAKYFPDGERDLILSSEKCDEKTIIVQSIIPPQDFNLISLLQLAYTAEEFGAKDITLVTPYLAYSAKDPYLAYSAKDRRQLPGEVVSIFNIFKMLQATPAKRLIVVDIHNPEVLAGKEMFFKNISAMPAFGEYYKKMNLESPLVLAPDKGAKERVSQIGKILNKERVSQIGKILNAETDFFEKKRDPITGETQTIPHKVNVKDRDVIIADEVIRSGGTIVKAIKALLTMDVGRIFVAATHLTLVSNADEKIIDAGAEELISTDSLPSDYSAIKIAPLIKEALEK